MHHLAWCEVTEKPDQEDSAIKERPCVLRGDSTCRFSSRFCLVTLSAQGSRSNISSLVYRFNWESTDVDHVQNTAVRQ